MAKIAVMPLDKVFPYNSEIAKERKCWNCQFFQLDSYCLFKAGHCENVEAVEYFQKRNIKSFEGEIFIDRAFYSKGIFCPFFKIKE